VFLPLELANPKSSGVSVADVYHEQTPITISLIGDSMPGGRRDCLKKNEVRDEVDQRAALVRCITGKIPFPGVISS